MYNAGTVNFHAIKNCVNQAKSIGLRFLSGYFHSPDEKYHLDNRIYAIFVKNCVNTGHLKFTRYETIVTHNPTFFEYLSILHRMELDRTQCVHSYWQLLSYKVQYLRAILFLVYKLTKEWMDVAFNAIIWKLLRTVTYAVRTLYYVL